MAIADATSLSLLHRLLDAPTVSRTVAVMESLKLGAEGLGALLAPALVAIFDVRTALIVAGLPLPLTIALSSGRLREADRVSADRSKVVALLHRVSVLRSLDMAALEDVAARARRVVVPAGTDVVRQGDGGDSYYVIEAGEVEIVIDGYRIGRLGPGSGFGDRALLHDAPRTATVRALSELVLQAIDREPFLSAITGRTVDELESERGGVGHALAAPRPLAEVFAGLAMFSGVDRSALEDLARAATLEHWQLGTTIVRQGEPARDLYVVVSGRAEAAINGTAVSELLPGDAFGEIAILHEIDRTATVTAVEVLTTFQVSASAVRALVASARDSGGLHHGR